jgi:hypothetical protein
VSTRQLVDMLPSRLADERRCRCAPMRMNAVIRSP